MQTKTHAPYKDFYLTNLKKASVVSKEVVGICPFHDDAKPSLYANMEKGVYFCQACGAKGNAITFAKKMNIDIKSVPGYNPEYFKDSEPDIKQLEDGRYVSTYIYHDETGNPLLKVRRTPDKQFHQFKFKNGNWEKGGLERHELVVYRLPEVLGSNGKTVFIVEGEKDADRLRDLGYTATCNPMGSGKWYAHYSAWFDYKDVIIIPDNDEPGKKHLKMVGDDLINRRKIKSLRAIYLYGEKTGFDISDYLEDHTLYDFETLIKNAPLYIPQKLHFWYTIDVNDSLKVKFDRVLFIKFLEFAGFGRYRVGKDYFYVRCTNNQIEEVTKTDIKDFVRLYIENLSAVIDGIGKDSILNALINNSSLLFCDNNLEYLDYLEIDLIKDTKDKAYFYYKNCVCEVRGDTVKSMDYNDFTGKIWRSKIINRNFFISNEFQKAEFYRFMRNVCSDEDDRVDALKTILGYLLHSYKNQGNAKAIVFMDQKLSSTGEANGRSGKSLIGKALKHLKNTCRIDGKNFKFSKNFAFQQVSFDTDIINFDDVTKDFDFEKLFSMITDDMQVEKKNKDEFTLSFDESPKFLVSTNYILKGNGASFEGRKFELEFSDHYNEKHTPEMDFGHLFFSGWNDAEWNLFDNLMVNCVKKYLLEGLINYNQINIKEKKLISESCMELRDFLDDCMPHMLIKEDEVRLRDSKRVDKESLFFRFTEDYKDFSKKLWQRTFNKWVKSYCNYRDIFLHEKKSDGKQYFYFYDSEKTAQIKTDEKTLWF